MTEGSLLSLQHVVLFIQVIAALGVILLVLLQHGKGADMGAAFGSGASGSLFGASGSANFLSRMTGILATVFFVATLALAFVIHGKARESGSLMDRAVPGSSAPADPASSIPSTSAPSAPAGPGSAGRDADAIPGSSAPAAGSSAAPTNSDAAQKNGSNSK